jgi:hypothetical protein
MPNAMLKKKISFAHLSPNTTDRLRATLAPIKTSGGKNQPEKKMS